MFCHCQMRLSESTESLSCRKFFIPSCVNVRRMLLRAARFKGSSLRRTPRYVDILTLSNQAVGHGTYVVVLWSFCTQPRWAQKPGIYGAITPWNVLINRVSLGLFGPLQKRGHQGTLLVGIAKIKHQDAPLATKIPWPWVKNLEIGWLDGFIAYCGWLWGLYVPVRAIYFHLDVLIYWNMFVCVCSHSDWSAGMFFLSCAGRLWQKMYLFGCFQGFQGEYTLGCFRSQWQNEGLVWDPLLLRHNNPTTGILESLPPITRTRIFLWTYQFCCKV